jgi:hypothetical protein
MGSLFNTKNLGGDRVWQQLNKLMINTIRINLKTIFALFISKILPPNEKM